MLGLKVPFGIDGAGYRRGLNTMRGQTKQWSNGIKGLIAGAFAFSAIERGLDAILSKYKDWSAASKVLNSTLEEAQKLQGLSTRYRASFDDAKELIANLNERVFEAATFAGHMEEEWAALGKTAQDFEGKAPVEKLALLAEALEDSEDKLATTSAGIALFGDDWKKVIELISAGSGEIRRVGEETAVTTGKTIDKVLAAAVAFEEVKNRLVSVFGVVAEGAIKFGDVVGSYYGAIFGTIATFIDSTKQRGLAEGFKESANFLMEEVRDASKRLTEEWESNEPVKELSIDASAAHARANIELGKLLAELHDKEEAHAQSMMTLEERRIELLEERARLEGEVSEETAEGVKAKLAVLAIDKELASNKSKSQAASDAIATGDKALEERVAEFKFKQLSPEDQLAAINKRLADNKETFGQLGKGKERTDLGNKIQDDIEARASLLGGLEPSEDDVVSAAGAAVVSSSLASIGGGAGAFVAIADPKLEEAKRHGAKFDQMVASLNEISGNTSGTSGNVNKNLNV